MMVCDEWYLYNQPDKPHLGVDKAVSELASKYMILASTALQRVCRSNLPNYTPGEEDQNWNRLFLQTASCRLALQPSSLSSLQQESRNTCHKFQSTRDAQLVSQSWEESQQPDELSEHAVLAQQHWDTSLCCHLQMRRKEMLSSRSKGCCGLQPVNF
ncbi:hypothetical protein HGM15179_004514 [Zosterops borbonicus]|uniref:Uncharacterized protein n=1 Tax=Zosterops borbonicus TaxID=364589 RepID=A0A8K1LQK5_9PASS|nr:hypothetical protein HGM15179_004514 [Zosterops borbonicus]